MAKVNFSEIEARDIFSEDPHYVVQEKHANTLDVKHIESGKIITLDKKYVEDLLSTGDQYEKEVKVGKEDKKDGTPGIRTIFEQIHTKRVFTVWFRKQDTPLSKTKYSELKANQIEDAVQKIEQAQKNKKGVANIAKQVLAEIQKNPVLDFEPGEVRELRGYKLQFESRDGKYNCFDMDFPDGDKPNGNVRLVNINTLIAIVVDNVKYVVEK